MPVENVLLPLAVVLVVYPSLVVASPSTLVVAVISVTAEVVDATTTTHGCLIHGLVSPPVHTHSSPSYIDTLLVLTHAAIARSTATGGGWSAWPNEHMIGSRILAGWWPLRRHPRSRPYLDINDVVAPHFEN
jgi:hypothetical protein